MSLFDIPKVEKELAKLESETLKNEFWNDSNNSSQVLKKIKILKDKKENFNKLNSELSNLLEMTELLKVELDGEMAEDILKNTKIIEEEIENLEITTLLSGKYEENNVSTEFDPKIKFRPTSNLSEISNYYVKNSKIVLFRRKSIHVVDYSYKFMFKLEWNVLRNILSSDEAHALQSFGIRLIYLLIFVFMKNRTIWLFMDRVSGADDNGEQIFKYAVNQNDGIEKYYVIEKDSDDFNRVSKQFKNILIFNSFKHRLLLLFTQKIITSHPDPVIINPYVYSEIDLFRGISNKDTYFL